MVGCVRSRQFCSYGLPWCSRDPAESTEAYLVVGLQYFLEGLESSPLPNFAVRLARVNGVGIKQVAG